MIASSDIDIKQLVQKAIVPYIIKTVSASANQITEFLVVCRLVYQF